MELKKFSDPDESFYAIKLGTAQDEYNLEEGDHFLLDYEISDNEETKQWNWTNGNITEGDQLADEGFAKEYKNLGKIFHKFEKLMYLPAWTYPSGRAFLAFNSIKSDIPSDLHLSIIAGLHAGNNWHGVIVPGYENLVKLQSFFLENEMKVNFVITSRKR